MRPANIPAWLLIATAALLSVVIFVIVVHPYFDVSSATVGEKIIVQVLGMMLTGIVAAVLLLPARRFFLASVPRPQFAKVSKPGRTRRI